MLNTQELTTTGYKFYVTDEAGREIGRAFLYLIRNDLHSEPFGLMEDIFVDEARRGQGLGKELIEQVINKARELGCYKLVATSRLARESVHEMYLSLGFSDYGKEFRMNF